MPIARIIRSLVPAIVLLKIASTFVRADDTDVTSPGAPAAVDETHPIFSADARWVAPTLVSMGGLFLAAVVVGRVVKAEVTDLAPSDSEEISAADSTNHGT